MIGGVLPVVNNRLWLVHKPSGRMILLGKHCPSCGWSAYSGPRNDPEAPSDLHAAIDWLMEKEPLSDYLSLGHPENFVLENEGEEIPQGTAPKEETA